ncbi:hypothetical protein ACHQM5_009669 [Ranunculus cassubicifolius]
MQLIEDSIRHAKEAILLDVEDGNSWYNLGNAYLTSFFATGSRHHKKLLESLKAYQHVVCLLNTQSVGSSLLISVHWMPSMELKDRYNSIIQAFSIPNFYVYVCICCKLLKFSSIFLRKSCG